MTTSNHRPFSYPDNKIDIPSKSNRDGAVKYADYAVGKLIENSKNKPWFDKTIFVFVDDHAIHCIYSLINCQGEYFFIELF
jgi:phosphoglycerol transferase MdoB-like AlkP superfamily enzyme